MVLGWFFMVVFRVFFFLGGFGRRVGFLWVLRRGWVGEERLFFFFLGGWEWVGGWFFCGEGGRRGGWREGRF